MALSGVFLIVAAAVLLVKFLYRAKEATIEVRKLHEISKIKSDAVKRAALKIEGLDKSDPKSIEVLEDLFEAQDRVKIETENVECELKKVEFMVSFNKWAFGAYFVAYVLGLVLMFTGFYMWYYRVQVFEDQIIELQATELLNKHGLGTRSSPQP
jgi:hypothetical protein